MKLTTKMKPRIQSNLMRIILSCKMKTVWLIQRREHLRSSWMYLCLRLPSPTTTYEKALLVTMSKMSTMSPPLLALTNLLRNHEWQSKIKTKSESLSRRRSRSRSRSKSRNFHQKSWMNRWSTKNLWLSPRSMKTFIISLTTKNLKVTTMVNLKKRRSSKTNLGTQSKSKLKSKLLLMRWSMLSLSQPKLLPQRFSRRLLQQLCLHLPQKQPNLGFPS